MTLPRAPRPTSRLQRRRARLADAGGNVRHPLIRQLERRTATWGLWPDL